MYICIKLFLFQLATNKICHWRNFVCLPQGPNSICQVTVCHKEVPCKKVVLKKTATPLERFHILVKLQARNLQLKNDMIDRYFVEFFQRRFVSEMEWALFKNLFWNINDPIVKLIISTASGTFFVRSALLLKYVKLWQWY